MDQSILETSGGPACSASMGAPASEPVEATTGVSVTKAPSPPGVQTDFSVTSRLLQHPSSSHYHSVPPPASKSDWQYHLPNDQGVVSSRHFWHGGAPNVSLPATQLKNDSSSQQRPSSNGHSSHSYAAPSDTSNLYTLYHAAMVHGPMSTESQRTLRHESIHYSHPPPYYPSPGMSYPHVTSGTGNGPVPTSVGVEVVSVQNETSPLQEQRPGASPSGSLIISVDSPAPVRSHHNGTVPRRHDGEEEDGEDSGDESDGDSSLHSQSSHGGNTSIEEPKKPKRTRTAYSNYQLDQLELVFQATQYPDVFLREELSTKLNIREDRIQVWFQNRRARFRKQERTGSVSHRARNRQRRLQRIMQHNQTMAMYAGYNPAPGGPAHATPPNAQIMPVPPQTTMSAGTYTYMPAFPAIASGQMPSSSPSSATTSVGSTEFPPSSSMPTYLPSFSHGFRPGFVPQLTSYMPRGLPATQQSTSTQP